MLHNADKVLPMHQPSVYQGELWHPLLVLNECAGGVDDAEYSLLLVAGLSMQDAKAEAADGGGAMVCDVVFWLVHTCMMNDCCCKHVHALSVMWLRYCRIDRYCCWAL
jgi:hypothetical protein